MRTLFDFFFPQTDCVWSEALCVTVIAQPRNMEILTEPSLTVSYASNEIQWTAKGSNETQWKNHYFFMMTERCRSLVILPWAAALTLRHCLNSNYRMADYIASVIQDDFVGVKSTTWDWITGTLLLVLNTFRIISSQIHIFNKFCVPF